jgi:valyl-tRNA synthetase
LESLVDWTAEAARHRKQLGDLDKQIAGANAKLGNASFVSKAPPEVVAQQQAKLAELTTQRAAVATLLAEAEARLARPR